MDKIDSTINNCTDFNALTAREILDENNIIPEKYPKPNSIDGQLVTGLSGEYYTSDPVMLQNKEPLIGMYYIGFALKDESWTGGMKPWMKGTLRRTFDDDLVAHGNTPIDLYAKAFANQYVEFTTGCPNGASLTADECKEFAEKNDKYNVIVGYWDNFPSGCVRQKDEDNYVTFYYNTNQINSKANMHVGDISSVCRMMPFFPETFAQVTSGLISKCPDGTHLTEARCLEAGLAHGGILRDGNIIVGNWPNTPYGCFLNPGEDNAIHYSINPQGVGGDRRFSLLCLNK